MTEFHVRGEWTSRPVGTGAPLRGVDHVFVHHEGGGVRGIPSDRAAVLRQIEAYVLGKGYAAIDYNLMVFQDGSVWEGRGYAREDAATLKWNAASVSICAVGNYERETPRPALLEGIAFAVRMAELGGWTNPTPVIAGHRDAGTFSTSCPGGFLEAQLPRIRQLAAGAPPAPTPPPTPATPAWRPQEGPMDAVWYPLDKFLHVFWIDPAGHLQHHYGTNPDGSPKVESFANAPYFITEPLDPTSPVVAVLKEETMGSQIQVRCRTRSGDLACFDWVPGKGWNAYAPRSRPLVPKPA